MLLFVFQYIYERNENGDKVVLGKGTYGVVYAGRDLSNQVRIAIKEIPEKDSTYEHFFPFVFSYVERNLNGPLYAFLHFQLPLVLEFTV